MIDQQYPPRKKGTMRCRCHNPRDNTSVCHGRNTNRMHCKVTDGWCAVTAIRDTPASPIKYTYFCTTDESHCQFSISKDNLDLKTECCVNGRKRCNQYLRPELPNRSLAIKQPRVTFRQPLATGNLSPHLCACAFDMRAFDMRA